MSSILYGSSKPHLDARLFGCDIFTAPANTTTDFYYTFTFNCIFNGMEIYSDAQNIGDKINIATEYYVPALDEWKRYKKFAKNFNIMPGRLQRYLLFPTKPKEGVRIKISYTNSSPTESTDLAINLFLFKDMDIVDTSTASEGEDW